MKKTFLLTGAGILFLLLFVQCNSPKEQSFAGSKNKAAVSDTMIAKRYFSGFEDAHDTYNAISPASDGKIYYVLSSTRYDVGGQFYCYDPQTDKTEFIADLSEALGEKAEKYIAQGKSHVEFYEHDNKLYFATHIGYYQMIDGAEQLPVTAPEGYKLYPGGHFLYYDMKTKELHSLGIAPEGEGIITMTMDKGRGHLYGLTWPKGLFIDYDLNAKSLKNLGHVTKAGETQLGTDNFRVICRSMFVDPRDGNVYYSTADGDIYSYNPADNAPRKLEDVDLRIDYFGKYAPPGCRKCGI